MRVVKRIMKRLKRMRRSSSSPGDKPLKGTDEQRCSGEMICVSETGESESNSAPAGQNWMEGEPWRVERVRRHGSPRESDWWKDPAGTHYIVDSNVMNDTSTSSTLDISDRTEDRRGINREKFRNCGLETWELTRTAWKQRRDPAPGKVRKSTWSKKKVRKAIIEEAADASSYDLPKPARLKDVVRAHTKFWESEVEAETEDCLDDALLLLYIPFVGEWSIGRR